MALEEYDTQHGRLSISPNICSISCSVIKCSIMKDRTKRLTALKPGAQSSFSWRRDEKEIGNRGSLVSYDNCNEFLAISNDSFADVFQNPGSESGSDEPPLRRKQEEPFVRTRDVSREHRVCKSVRNFLHTLFVS